MARGALDRQSFFVCRFPSLSFDVSLPPGNDSVPPTTRGSYAISFDDSDQRDHRPGAERTIDGRHGQADGRADARWRDDRYGGPPTHQGGRSNSLEQGQAFDDRWAVHRNEGGHRRLCDPRGKVEGTRDRGDEALPRNSRQRMEHRVRGSATRLDVNRAAAVMLDAMMRRKSQQRGSHIPARTIAASSAR